MAEDLVVRGIRLDTGDLQRGAQKSARELQKIDREIEGIEKTARSADEVMKRFTRTVVSLGGAYLGLRTAERAARFIFQTNVEFQKLEAQLKTVTGSTERAAAAFELITNFASSTPFEVQNLTEAFVALRARGVVPTEERLRGLGNVSSAFSGDITELSQAVISGANGMSRPLRRFGFDMEVSGERAVVSFQGVRREIGLNVEELSAFVAEMGNTGRLSTAMSDQMDTLGGALSNLADRASLFAKEVGEQGLNAEIVKVIRSFDEMIGDSDQLAQSLGQGAAGGVALFAGIVEDTIPLLERFSDLLGRFRDQADQIAAPQLPAIRGSESIEDLENQLRGLTRMRSMLVAQEERARAQMKGVPRTIDVRAPGADPVENPEFGRLQKNLETRRAAVQANDIQRQAAVDRLRQLASPDKPTFDPRDRETEEDKGTARKAKEEVDELAKALQKLEDGRREVAAMEAALEGTSVEFDANEERARELENAIRALAAIEDEAAKAVLPDLVEEYRDLVTGMAAAEERANKLREAEERLKEQRERHEERVAEAEVEEAAKDAARLEELAQSTSQNVGDAFADFVSGTEDAADAFSGMVNSILADLMRLASQDLIVAPLYGILADLMGISLKSKFSNGIQLGTFGIPGLAEGGDIDAGSAAIVGERGPELFVPRESGTVVPNHKLGGMGGGGKGGPTVVIEFAPNFYGTTDRRTAEEIVQRAAGEVARIVHDLPNIPGWKWN